MVQSFSVPINDQDIEILYLTVSADDQKIGIALGKTLIKEGYLLTEIAIYIRNEESGQFELEKLRDFDFSDSCKTFYFNIKNTNELFFFTMDEVFKLDYLDEGKERETVCTLDNCLVD